MVTHFLLHIIMDLSLLTFAMFLRLSVKASEHTRKVTIFGDVSSKKEAKID